MMTDISLDIGNKACPFINKTENKLTLSEKIKTICMFPICVIRIFLLVIFSLLTISSLALFTIGYHERNSNNELQDMTKCRRYLMFIVQFFARCVLYVLGFCC